jgi:hypothetical protein
MNALPVVDLDRVRPEPATPRLRHLAHIVVAARAEQAGVTVTTSVPCRRRPEHRPCAGFLRVRRQDLPDEIQWSCPVCGDGGVARRWRVPSWRPDHLAVALDWAS